MSLIIVTKTLMFLSNFGDHIGIVIIVPQFEFHPCSNHSGLFRKSSLLCVSISVCLLPVLLCLHTDLSERESSLRVG